MPRVVASSPRALTAVHAAAAARLVHSSVARAGVLREWASAHMGCDSGCCAACALRACRCCWLPSRGSLRGASSSSSEPGMCSGGGDGNGWVGGRMEARGRPVLVGERGRRLTRAGSAPKLGDRSFGGQTQDLRSPVNNHPRPSTLVHRHCPNMNPPSFCVQGASSTRCLSPHS